LEVLTEGNYFATGGNDGNVNVFRALYQDRLKRRRLVNCEHVMNEKFEAPILDISSLAKHPEIIMIASNFNLLILDW